MKFSELSRIAPLTAAWIKSLVGSPAFRPTSTQRSNRSPVHPSWHDHSPQGAANSAIVGNRMKVLTDLQVFPTEKIEAMAAKLRRAANGGTGILANEVGLRGAACDRFLNGLLEEEKLLFLCFVALDENPNVDYIAFEKFYYMDPNEISFLVPFFEELREKKLPGRKSITRPVLIDLLGKRPDAPKTSYAPIRRDPDLAEAGSGLPSVVGRKPSFASQLGNEDTLDPNRGHQITLRQTNGFFNSNPLSDGYGDEDEA